MTADRILIVDDDVCLARMLVELLAAENFQPAHASNGAAALACLARRSFDLLILDVMMPKMDGLELLRRLRKEGSVPVLMLTARGDERDRGAGELMLEEIRNVEADDRMPGHSRHDDVLRIVEHPRVCAPGRLAPASQPRMQPLGVGGIEKLRQARQTPFLRLE